MGLRRRLVLAAFLLYLAIVGYGVFGPEPGEQVRRAGQAVRELRPTSTPPPTAGTAPAPPAGDRVVGDLTSEEAGNIAMFVPLGVFLPVLWPRQRWWTFPAGIALSCSIELVQRQFLDWRSPQVRDVVWNGTGALLGFLGWLLVTAAGRRVLPAWDAQRNRIGRKPST